MNRFFSTKSNSSKKRRKYEPSTCSRVLVDPSASNVRVRDCFVDRNYRNEKWLTMLSRIR